MRTGTTTTRTPTRSSSPSRRSTSAEALALGLTPSPRLVQPQARSPVRREPCKESMSTDFTALASVLAGGLPELRACLLVSRDGLALGSHPADEEARTLGAWARITALGDVERGFVVVGEELWPFCRRGSYSATAIPNAGARPAL